MRCVEKEARDASLSGIENLSSLENILHLLFHAIRRGVELFAEVVNYFLIFVNSRVI
jgi:hypothetical protein